MYSMMLDRSRKIKENPLYFRDYFKRPPQPHRYTPMRRKAMSIGLGIKCKDGVVLAADTEMTVPYWFKFSESKIRILRTALTPVFFAFAANDVPFCLMFIDRLCNILQIRIPSGKSVQEIVREEAKSFYSEYRPLFSDDNRFPDVLVVQQGGTSVGLWNLSGGISLHTVPQSSCVGAGSGFAINLLKRLSRRNMPVKEALYVAAYVLSEVKTSGYSCGKESQILAIRPLNTRDNFNPLGFDVMQPRNAEELETAYRAALDALFPLLTTRDWPTNQFTDKLAALTKLLENNLEVRRAQMGGYEQRAIEQYLADQPPDDYEREPDEEDGVEDAS